MNTYAGDPAFRAAVERRLDRPFARVQLQLCTLFSREWDEVEVFIATSASKKGRDEVDVIADLVAKAEAKPPAQQVVRRAVVRWMGKPWRERRNPWDDYKHKVRRRPATPPTDGGGEAWTPLRPDDD